MHAYALEWMKDYLIPGGTVLDVGSGSGYLCAAFLKMMEGEGKVVGIDHIQELVDWSRENLEKSFSEELKNDNIELVVGDGRVGYPEKAPYNCIHVGAAAAEIPESLLE